MTQPIREDLIKKAIAGQESMFDATAPQKDPGPQPDLVSRAISMPEKEVSLKQRMLLGLIKEDPELQMEFLNRQGFESKLEDGVVKIKSREGAFKNYNPEGLDFGDILEYLPEVVEGVVGTVATGAKVLGAVGAPATGGASLLATSALSGAATGATELGKQQLAKGLGLREDTNLGRVGRQAAIGAAIPGIMKGAGAGLGAAKRGLSKAIFGSAAPKQIIDKEGIKAAGKLLGAKPTPGMLTEDAGIRTTESILSKQTLGLGGSVLRTQVKVNERAAIEAAESLLANKSSRSAFEVGETFKSKVLKDVSKKLKPAEDLYSEVGKALGEVKADTGKISQTLDALKERMKFSTEGTKLIKSIEDKVGQITSAEDLKLFRTAVRDEIPPTASKNLKIVADELYNAATAARKDSFVKGVRNLKGQFQPKAQQELLSKIQEADKIYAQTARDVQKALLTQGKQITKGVKRQAGEAVEAVIPEKRGAKFFPGQDTAKVQALKKLSPEGFNELSRARLSDIAEKATSTAKGSFGKLNPKIVASEIDKLSPEIAKEMFGEHGLKKAQALAKFYRAIPPDVNPSGTATTLDILAFPFRQVSSLSLSALNTLLRSKKNVSQTAAFVALSKGLEQD